MKYAGMPMGMWVLFAGSFQKQLAAVLGYDADTAKAITKKAKPQYREIIRRLPEFEKADRFKMNIVNCAIQKPNAIKSVTVPMIFSFARRVMPCPCTKDSKLSR